MGKRLSKSLYGVNLVRRVLSLAFSKQEREHWKRRWYGVCPGLLGQFTSVTYPRRTSGKRLRSDYVTRNTLATRNNEAKGLGKATTNHSARNIHHLV